MVVQLATYIGSDVSVIILYLTPNHHTDYRHHDHLQSRLYAGDRQVLAAVQVRLSEEGPEPHPGGEDRLEGRHADPIGDSGESLHRHSHGHEDCVNETGGVGHDPAWRGDSAAEDQC